MAKKRTKKRTERDWHEKRFRPLSEKVIARCFRLGAKAAEALDKKIRHQFTLMPEDNLMLY